MVLLDAEFAAEVSSTVDDAVKNGADNGFRPVTPVTPRGRSLHHGVIVAAPLGPRTSDSADGDYWGQSLVQVTGRGLFDGELRLVDLAVTAEDLRQEPLNHKLSRRLADVAWLSALLKPGEVYLEFTPPLPETFSSISDGRGREAGEERPRLRVVASVGTSLAKCKLLRKAFVEAPGLYCGAPGEVGDAARSCGPALAFAVTPKAGAAALGGYCYARDDPVHGVVVDIARLVADNVPMVAIHGPPGTGKTFLLRKIIAEATAGGEAAVFTGITNATVNTLAADLPVEDVVVLMSAAKAKEEGLEESARRTLAAHMERDPGVRGARDLAHDAGAEAKRLTDDVAAAAAEGMASWRVPRGAARAHGDDAEDEACIRAAAAAEAAASMGGAVRAAVAGIARRAAAVVEAAGLEPVDLPLKQTKAILAERETLDAAKLVFDIAVGKVRAAEHWEAPLRELMGKALPAFVASIEGAARTRILACATVVLGTCDHLCRARQLSVVAARQLLFDEAGTVPFHTLLAVMQAVKAGQVYLAGDPFQSAPHTAVDERLFGRVSDLGPLFMRSPLERLLDQQRGAAAAASA